MTEIPALALLAGGIWLWAVAAPARATYAAGVAGFLLGLTFLMRPDGLFTVGAVALLAAWLLATGRFDRTARALVLATAVTAAVTFAHVGALRVDVLRRQLGAPRARGRHRGPRGRRRAGGDRAGGGPPPRRRRRPAAAPRGDHRPHAGDRRRWRSRTADRRRPAAGLERRHLADVVRDLARPGARRRWAGGRRDGSVRARPRRRAAAAGRRAARHGRHLRHRRPRLARPLLGDPALRVGGAAAAGRVRRPGGGGGVVAAPAARRRAGAAGRDGGPRRVRPVAGPAVRRVPRLDGGARAAGREAGRARDARHHALAGSARRPLRRAAARALPPARPCRCSASTASRSRPG